MMSVSTAWGLIVIDRYCKSYRVTDNRVSQSCTCDLLASCTKCGRSVLGVSNQK